jgi:hypothetical protein
MLFGVSSIVAHVNKLQFVGSDVSNKFWPGTSCGDLFFPTYNCFPSWKLFGSLAILFLFRPYFHYVRCGQVVVAINCYPLFFF